MLDFPAFSQLFCNAHVNLSLELNNYEHSSAA